MIQIAIVEDEEIYVKQLTEYIRKYQTERGSALVTDHPCSDPLHNSSCRVHQFSEGSERST